MYLMNHCLEAPVALSMWLLTQGAHVLGDCYYLFPFKIASLFFHFFSSRQLLNSGARCMLSTVATIGPPPVCPSALPLAQVPPSLGPKLAKVDIHTILVFSILSATEDLKNITVQSVYYNFCGDFIHNTSICTNCSICMCHQFERGGSSCVAFDSLKDSTIFCCILCHHHRQGNNTG